MGEQFSKDWWKSLLNEIDFVDNEQFKKYITFLLKMLKNERTPN